MYENGRRVNGYQRKRLHKRKVKKSYAKTWYYGDGEYAWNYLVIQYKDEPRSKWGHPLDYWKEISLSGPRAHAKKQTNKALRREFKNHESKIVLAEFEDSMEHLPRLANGDYRRYYDYSWTVW